MKIKTRFKIFGVCAALLLAACLPAPAAMTPYVEGVATITNVPTGGTNAAGGTITNTTSTQIIPIFSGDGNHPFPIAIWPSSAGVTAGLYTNTYTFANSPDGTTLAQTNTWSVTLVGNGTNIIEGYTLASITNFQGAIGFGLLSVTEGGTNGITNGIIKITIPH